MSQDSDSQSPAIMVSSEASDLFNADELAIIRYLRQPKPEELKSHEVRLGEKTKRYTLFLDLDETLVYSHHVSGGSLSIKVRPLADRLLAQLSVLYEIVIFTASEEEYAQEVARLLDPNQTWISRVLSRRHCIPVACGLYVKDLRVVTDRKLDEMLIADNSIVCFAFQPGNGIPVYPYDGSDCEDQELGYLATYLQGLYEAQNIVATNKANIGLPISVS